MQEKIYAHDYRDNGNINEAFPWVFLFILLFDPDGHLHFINSSKRKRESKPYMGKPAKQPVFSPMAPPIG